MSRKSWYTDDYDDYDDYDGYNDYDYYDKSGSRRRLGDFSNYDYYYGNPGQGKNDKFRGGSVPDRGSGGGTGVSSGILYALMIIFLGIMVMTVLFGKMYVNSIINEQDSHSDNYLPPESYDPPESREEPVDELTRVVEERLNSMTTEQKVGQLFMVRNNGKGSFNDTVSQTHAGGAILFADDFRGKTAEKVRNMIGELQQSSDGRMIIAVDEEGGTVVRVSRNTRLRRSKFLSPQELYRKGGFDLIISDTVEKCELLDSLGINMNMAPVADVCTSSKGFMYKRAFGMGAEETAEYVSKVVGTMKNTPVASCVKHFPGYGNSEADTHKGLDVNEKSLYELEENDLVPFEAAISEGADGIMLTHTIVSSIDPDHPASLSSDVVNMIRGKMGFDGLLITDGLEMEAVIDFSGGDSGKVCVMAVNAGIDILCAPNNPVSDYNAVLEAVNSGEIPMERVNDSVRRILRFKRRFDSSDESTTESDDALSEFTTVTTTQATKSPSDDDESAVG